MASPVELGAARVLIIDDQEFVRTIVAKMLAQLGVTRITQAQDGNSGLAEVARERPDVVLCDVQMRPMDGFGFVRMLRATPGCADLPVILLTSHHDGETIARARDVGVNAFLVKPVTPAALKDKIQKMLGVSARIST